MSEILQFQVTLTKLGFAGMGTRVNDFFFFSFLLFVTMIECLLMYVVIFN